MAEAAALALGAQLLKAMQVHQPFFLSDNQQLVSFLNDTGSYKSSTMGDQAIHPSFQLMVERSSK
jgi:hypothetical protein